MFPSAFERGDLDAIRASLANDGWVLVAVVDDGAASGDLAQLCGSETAAGCIENFACFTLASDSDDAAAISVADPGTLVVFYHTADEAYRRWTLDADAEYGPEDLVKFLDDTASMIECEDEDEVGF